MNPDLAGKRIAFLVAEEGVEQSELVLPWQAVKRYSGRPDLLAPTAVRVRAMKHLDKGDTFAVDNPIHGVAPDRYAGVVLPGGVFSADALRLDADAIAFMQKIFAAHKPVAVIGHGAWLLVEAGLVEARTLTACPTLQTDIRNAGGQWVDAEVHVCSDGPNPLVSSRNPDDIPAFNRALLDVFTRSDTRAAERVDRERDDRERDDRERDDRERAADEALDEAGRESFPASDPPASNGGVVGASKWMPRSR